MESYRRSLKESARSLRSNMTDAERFLWKYLRRKQIRGVQFYRQKPILNFIVDFYCAKARLVIELDGSQHFEVEHQQKDATRDKALAVHGLRVLRFDNRQVLTETRSVLTMIDAVVGERLGVEIPPNPPFTKGELDMGQVVSVHFKNHHQPASPFEKGGLRGIYFKLNEALAA